MKIRIENDLFDIASRLKEINQEYVVVFNTDSQKFEIEVDGKTQLILPFEHLDERTLRRAYYTRSENALNLVADLEKENEDMLKDKLGKAKDRVEDEFSRAARKMGL